MKRILKIPPLFFVQNLKYIFKSVQNLITMNFCRINCTQFAIWFKHSLEHFDLIEYFENIQ